MEAYTGMSVADYDRLCGTVEGQQALEREKRKHAFEARIPVVKLVWYKAHGKAWIGVSNGRKATPEQKKKRAAKWKEIHGTK